MKYILSTILICSFLFCQGQNLNNFLFPHPQSFEFRSGYLNNIYNHQYEYQSFIKTIQNVSSLNIVGEVNHLTLPFIDNSIYFKIDSNLNKTDEYLLTIDTSKIVIKGKNKAALFYGKQTLNQIITYSTITKSPIPCLQINDWADFERRGFMLDISRDKVPTMETLFHIIDLLASWKINEFQLYTEHTFAYKNHQIVWKEASPITAEEIQILNLYCNEKHIDLVPNQNSFGHMENWLMHDEYLELAECPTDCNTIWGTRSRTSLNPINPGSFILMQELYSELLPNFTSKYFNIGCDETVELGCGQSKEYCEKHGKGNVYLEYLMKLNDEVNKHGKTTQFWGDIILNHPDLIPHLPKNMIAMVWGYESTYPFNEQLQKFKQANVDFYVCPGTSTWRSEIGRNHDAFINLQQAAIFGKQYGAKGYLNTNWGDYGHWQPLSVCYPAMAVGAAYAWKSDWNPTNNLKYTLNTYVFKDTTGNTAEAVLKLGDAYLKCKIPEGNANAFHLMLRRFKWTMGGHFQTKHLKVNNLINAKNDILEAKKLLDNANPTSADSSIIIKELIQAIDLALHGIHLGIARLNAKNNATENISQNTLNELINELNTIITNHDNIWGYRNRPGGKQLSIQKMQDLLDYYIQISK